VRGDASPFTEELSEEGSTWNLAMVCFLKPTMGGVSRVDDDDMGCCENAFEPRMMGNSRVGYGLGLLPRCVIQVEISTEKWRARRSFYT
jgi:hypothetical protein